MEIYQRYGVTVARLGEDEIRQLEPALSRDFRWA
jgi:hypothetical protein